jgi:hypothetical protein
MRFAVPSLMILTLTGACSGLPERSGRFEANPAPCPNAFVLNDAARFITFGGDEETLDDVAFSGEFVDLTTNCRYFDDRPIRAELDFVFDIGRGPAADAGETTVRYFVAVTRTDRDVIAKETFEIPVRFKAGQDVVRITQNIDEIVIPRAGEGISGVNFEIAVGFALEREQVLFNRSGKSLKFPEA